MIGLRGKPSKLNLQQRMEVRRRAREWLGLKRHIYAQLATEYRVSSATIIRTVLG